MALAKAPLLLIVLVLNTCYADDFMLYFKKDSSGTGYGSQIKVGNRKVVSNFELTTLATEIVLVKCSSRTTKTSFTVIHRTGSFNNEAGATFKGINVQCVKTQQSNVLALGPNNGSFPFQFARAAKVSSKFSYCLPAGSKTGEIYFGHQGRYRLYYNTDILNATFAPMTYISGLESSFFGGYQITLSSMLIGKKTFNVNTFMLVGLVVRYTSVPQDVYNVLRTQFIREAASMKLIKDSSTYDGLDLCYFMTVRQLSKFSKFVMNFGGANWVVAPENYVQVSNKKGVFCFGIRNSAQNPRGVSAIGTLQQENNFVEYDLEKKKFGVSGSLVANLGLTCDNTHGS